MSEESLFVTWAREEIRRAGLFDKESDYDGMLGDELMKMVRTFSEAGHSGFSASIAASAFQQLAAWKPLTPLTSDRDEWQEVTPGPPGVWQSRRAPSCFSNDGGRSYYDIDEPVSRWRRWAQRLTRRRWERRYKLA